MRLAVVKMCPICKGDGLIDVNPVSGGGTRPCPHCCEAGEIVDRTIDFTEVAAGLTKIHNKCKAILAAVEALGDDE